MRYNDKNLSRLWDLFDEGLLPFTVFSALEPGELDWQQGYIDFSTFQASFRFEFQRFIDGRFSSIPPPCTFLLTFPTRLFEQEEESEGQRNLLNELAEVFVRHKLSYCFANLGRRDFEPRSVGGDDVFHETIRAVPITAFYYDLTLKTENVHEEQVRTAFWANLLGPKHVQKHGGYERIERAVTVRERGAIGRIFTGARSSARIPVFRYSRLPDGGALLVLTPSPLLQTPKVEKTYQAGRSLFRPLLPRGQEEWIERSREIVKVTREVSAQLQRSVESERESQGDSVRDRDHT